MQFFQQRYAAEVASRIAFNESVASVLAGAAATAVLDFMVAMFFLLLLLQYSVPLTIIGVVLSAAEIAVFFALRRKITDLNMRVQQEAGKEYGTLMNGIMMIESVKANGSEGDLFSKWAGYHAKVLSVTQEIEIWSLSASALPVFLTALNTALVMTVGGFSIMAGLMTAGIYMAFQNLMGNFQAPMNRLVNLGTTLQSTEMQMRRLDDVRRYPVDDFHYGRVLETTGEIKEERLSGELELRDISFGYSPLDPPLLENFSLHLAPGRWVAVVGSSGSGKSTLAKVVSGLYEEWSGDVLMDGKNRRQISRLVFTSSIAVVDQDIFLLSGTVQENIALFDTSIKRSDVIQAAKDACIHEDILRLEGGYESKVSEGGFNFSGGQRQRLCIARALIAKPKIVIFDDSTSAVDTRTDSLIRQSMREFLPSTTKLIIAQRTASVEDADRILVIDDGRIIADGPHDELLETSDIYREIYTAQNREGGDFDVA